MVKSFFCIDAHTCGNPVRVVAGGGPALEGANMSEKRQHFLREFDWIRRGLMFEPRGHDMMSGSILYPPSDAANDVSILFIETSGCLPMCGHGTMGLIATLADMAFAYACNSYNELTVASGFDVDLLGPGKPGDRLTASGRVVSQGSRMGVYDIEVTNQSGERIAVFRGRSYRMKGKQVVT